MIRWAAGLLVLAGCAPTADRNFPKAGRTYLSVDPAHGVQIEYLDVERAWLWYPGNARVVTGGWRIPPSNPPAICWTYERGSRNPVTGQPGEIEGCERLAEAAGHVRESLPGDVFDLQSGQVPYRRSRCDVPLPFKALVADC